jgi:hypothetical protein
VTVDVEFTLTDRDYHPLPNISLRIAVGQADWQSPEAGVTVVTGSAGSARLSTDAQIDRRWRWLNYGFTPIKLPHRAEHLAIALELEMTLPGRDGDRTRQWLYTADIYRFRNGDCSTDGLDRIYELGEDRRFSRLLGGDAVGANFQTVIDGLILSGGGYELWNFQLLPAESNHNEHWQLNLGLMRLPKAQLR